MLRRVAHGLMATAAGFSGLAYILPNTLFLDKLQSIVSLYRYAEQVPISLEMRSLMDQVMSDMKLEEEDRSKIRLFTIWGFEGFYAGSIWKNKYVGELKQAIIGIPEYFNWKLISSIEKDDIVFQRKKLNWTSEAGLKLGESLIISDKAKKFAMAQQIFYVSKNEPAIKAFATSVIASICAIFIRQANNIKRIQGKEYRFVRYSFISVGVLFNLALWVTIKDVYRCNLESQADEAVAQLGKEYIEGGLEYFDSIITRNMSIKSLTTMEGNKSPFSIFGNEETLIRQKHIPLNARRDFFKKLLAD